MDLIIWANFGKNLLLPELHCSYWLFHGNPQDVSSLTPFSCFTLPLFSGQLRGGECLLSECTASLVTKEESVYNFLNFYTQMFFQDDFMVKLPAQGSPVPLKQMLLHILTLYHYTSRFINIRRMRKYNKIISLFWNCCSMWDGKKMLYILQGYDDSCKD